MSTPRSIRLLIPSLAIVGLSLLGAVLPDTARAADACREGKEVRIWTAPLQPSPGAPLEIIAVATDADLDEVLITDPAGRQTSLRTAHGGGPPWSLYGTQFRPVAGIYRIETTRAGRVAGCAEVRVGGRDRTQGSKRGSGEWDLATEAFYSAWIEHLFEAPPEQLLSFDSLGPVLRDPARNLLFNYLGNGEDHSLPAEPDCADLPYFLRTYFAWKLGLPVAYRPCTRGSRSSAPTCQAPVAETRFVGASMDQGASAEVFREASRSMMNTVHSGSARTALRDDATDFYPVALDRSTLWPGTIFADPYGHIMVIVKWLPQRGRESGLLLAVDAQPDNSVTRKRFWEGTFLFAQTPSAGPGFKAFRPVVQTGSGVRQMPNNAIDGRSGLPPFSLEQAALSPADFYARMQRLVNPRGLEPEVAYTATLDALMEQLETRVTSVENGEAYVRSRPGITIPMPSGPAIFETTGPWEDYATPSRDMRLLIAMKVLADLPERIRRYPELFVLQGRSPSDAAARIERMNAQRMGERFITYTRSDGTPWRLSLGEIFSRRAELEMAYNPNDCVERRWGASPGSPDESTCRRRAPADQRARMEEYRPWFREAVRPPR
ncbi:hypothetical protein [Thiocapsa marina]|uniref:Uncharacterized protein n=1 Tax=Thiocapsa marina 5811 TaxID=768671 RepID=F9UI56_9GAMM|nr:hypothetical protein [Thiocapsa marina]EGV16115.1 hypothetical protein ThimaDRAFT_4609 [Thiocapsa marina 5811]